MSDNTSTGSANPAPAPAGGGGEQNVSSTGSPNGVAAVVETEQAVVVDLPSYESDCAAMLAHTEFLDTRILVHFEALIASAEQQEMGADLLQALNEGLEKTRNAKLQVQSALQATVRLNQAVAQAYADAAGAAKKKTYYVVE